MSSNIQYGFPDVPKSITNPQVISINAIDTATPMSFILFIKTIDVSFEPEKLQLYYSEYLKRWNLMRSDAINTEKHTIAEKYRDFIRDITLNYTTIEESKFLNNLDFTDSFDLDVALSFYSKKLREIADYYNSKRHDVKFELVRKKSVGSVDGLKKTIFEKTIEYLENNEAHEIVYDIPKIKRDLHVNVCELYNVFGDEDTYFNRDPDVNIYDFKDIDYGEDIFLRNDADLIADIFGGEEPVVSTLKESDTLFDNKRQLTINSMGTDFYYLSTGSTTTDYVSGMLFEASNKSKNILNRLYPTTASTLKGAFIDSQTIGFFKPSKLAIIFIDGSNSEFSFDTSELEANKIYYFPDPKVFPSQSDFISFTTNDDFLKKNYSSGAASNYPSTQPNDTKYYGYVSANTDARQSNFESIFESGYISDQKTDISNNTYGLLKNGDSFKKGIKNEEPKTIKSLLLNGHTFYDELYGEGFAFDYTVADDTTYTETIRAGLSTNTNGFSALSGEYTLFYRYFTPYDELLTPTEPAITPTFQMLEGAFFTNGLGIPYDDPISSDLLAFPSNLSYYHSKVFEGGIHDASGSQRALLDVVAPAITAVFTESPRDYTGSEDIDGGRFTTEFEFDYTIPVQTFVYDSTVFDISEFTVDTFDKTTYGERTDLNGQIFIKEFDDVTNTLTDAMGYLSSRYAADIYSELSSVNNFDLVYDTLCIETDNYLVIEKSNYVDGSFTNPKTSAVAVEHNLDSFNKLSNRFKVGNDIYYYVAKTGLSASPPNAAYYGYGATDPSSDGFYYITDTDEWRTVEDNTYPLRELILDTSDYYLYYKESEGVITSSWVNIGGIITGDTWVADFNASGTPQFISCIPEGNDTLIYPEIYKFNVVTQKNEKIFPLTDEDVFQSHEIFNVSNGGDVRYTDVTSPRITYNSKNDIFNTSMLIKDQNGLFTIHEYDFIINPDVEFISKVKRTPTSDNYSNIMEALSSVTVAMTPFLSSGTPTFEDETLTL